MTDTLHRILPQVQKPARYVGGEYNQIVKDKRDVDVRVAFCFPDTYEIGMSNIGMRILYGLMNELPGVWCERVFAPWGDMEEKMREHAIPLYALESHDPVRAFDLIAFTIGYEMSYTNILNMLDLSDVPLLARERKGLENIVFAGGVCAVNPEPLADFIDFFSFGEGEEITKEILACYRQAKKDGCSKEEFLLRVSRIDGVYVPSFYEHSYNPDGMLAAITPKNGAPAKVRKRIVQDMDAAYFPISQYNLAGDRAEAVTGFGVQSGFLMIFKEHSVGRAELSTSEIDGRAYLTLNYTNVNSETGCDLPWTIRLVENNLVFCNREQGVHIVKSTTPALENNIESISRNVNGTAERHGLLYDVRKAGDVCACDDGDRYWLAANGHVYVWDYVLSSAGKPSWFYFTNIRAAAFFLADETVHHLSPSGRVTRMERTYADYNGPIDKVYRFATQHFGSYDRLKDVRRVVFQTRSDTDTKIRITYKSDYETRRDLTDIESFSWRLCPRDLTHRYLGVPQFALAAVRKPGCRHVRHFTMTLENHEAFRDMSLVGAQIYYNYQGRDR